MKGRRSDILGVSLVIVMALLIYWAYNHVPDRSIHTELRGLKPSATGVYYIALDVPFSDIKKEVDKQFDLNDPCDLIQRYLYYQKLKQIDERFWVHDDVSDEIAYAVYKAGMDAQEKAHNELKHGKSFECEGQLFKQQSGF